LSEAITGKGLPGTTAEMIRAGLSLLFSAENKAYLSAYSKELEK
jgi:hypothetical protein